MTTHRSPRPGLVALILTVVLGGWATLLQPGAAIPAASGSHPASSPPGTRTAAVDGLTVTTDLTGLGKAIAVREAPNGRIYVALKRGQLVMYDGPGDTSASVIVDRTVEAHQVGDRGLLGLEIDPQFATGRPYIYILYVYNFDPFGTSEMPRWHDGTTDACPVPPGDTEDGCTVTGRLERFTIGSTGFVVPGSRKLLLDGATDGRWCFQYPSHSIGTVRFGPDGALYVGAGEGASFNLADYGQLGGRLTDTPTPANPCNDGPLGRGQALTSATSQGGALRAQAVRAATPSGPVTWDGAILRVDPDTGAALPSNPLVNNGVAGDDRIVAYGLRNPFRFNFRTGTNQLWLGDVGWTRWEELDSFTTGPGQSSVPNFGWPCREGNRNQPTYDAAAIDLCESLYANPQSSLGGVPSPLVDPVFSWPHTVGTPLPAPGCGDNGGNAAVGGVFLTGDRWPSALRGAYVFADYARGCLAYLPAGAGGEPDPTRPTLLLAGTYAVDLQQDADGDLYWSDIAAGTIQRLSPTTAGNQPPVPSFTATPGWGLVPLTVSFDASGTVDPDGDPVTYTWDLDGDGSCDDASGVTTSRIYSDTGDVVVTLCTSDPAGATATTTTTVHAGISPPVITSLTSNVRTDGFKVDDLLTFTAAATEPDGTPIPSSGYDWVVEMRHCEDPSDTSCHTHILTEVTGGSSVSVRAPDHEYYTFVRARLTVAGASGLTSQATADARPHISTVTLRTSPSGISVSNGFTTGPSPVSASYTWGGLSQLLVPTTAIVSGKRFAFDHWADGATVGVQRDITVPKADITRAAVYVLADTAPVPGAWSISPTTGVSRPVDFSVTAPASDDVGVVSARIRLTDPTGTIRSRLLTLTEGTAADGTWTGRIRIGLAAPAGAYRSSLVLTDTAGKAVVSAGPTISIG